MERERIIQLFFLGLGVVVCYLLLQFQPLPEFMTLPLQLCIVAFILSFLRHLKLEVSFS